MKTFKIGEEAILNLETFDKNKLKKKVRRAERHIENLNIEVFFCNPQTLPKIFYNDIYKLSKNWLIHKGKKEKGFSMTLGRIPNELDKDCQFAIAIQNNAIIGFLSFTPVYAKNMLSLDISRRIAGSPNGLTEFLIIKAAEYFKQKGVKKISLNFATFVGMITSKTSLKHKVIHLTSQVLKKLYRVDSIHEFNQKFLPIWESRYVAYFSKINFPLYLLAVLRAER
ncbi:DUF2156 domain-containing protein [Candidatus Roizmanbacteria bacterium]|nr:DUF2156 domain-containing protein [Candidatus Roizmanbacteria bacterium]